VTWADYWYTDLWAGTSRGGITVTIDGYQHPGVVTGVDAVVPACPRYRFGLWDDSIVEGASCGTSWAQPQVAGAAVLVKDWFVETQGSIIDGQGRLYTALLAMTDRANGPTSFKNVYFDKDWGGGRFQSRYLTSAGESGVFLWSLAAFTLSAGQTATFYVGGAGNEPTTLNQFKAHAVFFEQDGVNISDIDLYVKDKDCGAGSVTLRSDLSRDTKSMVRLSGAEAAGKALCVQAYAYAAPTPTPVVLFVYYSQDTFMR